MAQIKTSYLLATMHSFPAIIVVSENMGVAEAFDRLRDSMPVITGFSESRGGLTHLEFCSESQILRPILESHFEELANEIIPDEEFWDGKMPASMKGRPELERLRIWVKEMEQKYGDVIEVPDLRREVIEARKGAAPMQLPPTIAVVI